MQGVVIAVLCVNSLFFSCCGKLRNIFYHSPRDKPLLLQLVGSYDTDVEDMKDLIFCFVLEPATELVYMFAVFLKEKRKKKYAGFNEKFAIL